MAAGFSSHSNPPVASPSSPSDKYQLPLLLESRFSHRLGREDELRLYLLPLLLRRLSSGSCQPTGRILCKLPHKKKSGSVFPRFKRISSGQIRPSKPCIIAFVAEGSNCFCRSAILGYRQICKDFVFLQRATKSSQDCGVHNEQYHSLGSYRSTEENANF